MRALLIALLLCCSTIFAGCISENQDTTTSSDFIGCQEGQPEEETEECEIILPDQTNTSNPSNNTVLEDNQTTSNNTNNTNNSNITIVEENNTNENNETNVSEPVYGSLEGYQVHPLFADARELGGSWNDWNLYSHFNNSWGGTPNGTVNGTDHKWVLIEFLSTDCGHCWNAADEMSNYSSNYSDQLEIISIAVNFSSNNNFNASLDEIAAFQDKTSHSGCIGNNYDCSSRPGDPHDWLYVDGRNQSYMYTMQATGTPMFVIIMPNGSVAWNQYQHNGGLGEDIESIASALERFFGPMQ